MITYTIIYIVGFILMLLFYIKFGKKIGFDYSGPKTYSNFDDWNNNTEAYTCFSLFWPITMTILSIAGLWKLLTKITSYFIV